VEPLTDCTCLVPIYDGRNVDTSGGFLFTDEDFATLASWPQWQGSAEDIPTDSLVSVGYSVNTYTEKGVLRLSANILFVILLAFIKE
jgi:hypothetical protein